jgi:hypothetical protein
MTTSSQPTRATPPLRTYGSGSVPALEVAAQLEDIGKSPQLSGRRAQLKGLAAALSTPDQLRRWHGIPLHAAVGYPIPEEQEQEQGSRIPILLSSLGALRLALIFVPVCVTWLGISAAASQYRQEIARKPEIEGESFFLLWLQGFGGRLWISFEAMALVIATAVFCIIILSLTLEFIRYKHEHGTARSRNLLQEKLNAILTEAALHIASAQSSAPEHVLKELAGVAQGLQGLVLQVDLMTDKAVEAARTVSSAASVAEETTRHLRDGTSTLTLQMSGVVEHVAHANEVVLGTREAVGNLANVVADLQHSLDQVAARASEDRENIGSLLREHRKDMGELLPSLADLISKTHTAALNAQMADLRRAIEKLSHSHESVSGLRDAIECLVESVSRGEAGSLGIEKAASTLADAASTLQGLIQEGENELRESRRHIEVLLRDQTERVANMMPNLVSPSVAPDTIGLEAHPFKSADVKAALQHLVQERNVGASEGLEQIVTVLHAHRESLRGLLPALAENFAKSQAAALEPLLSTLNETIAVARGDSTNAGNRRRPRRPASADRSLQLSQQSGWTHRLRRWLGR